MIQPEEPDTNLSRKGKTAVMRFLLVEDNAELARALCQRFALDGHVVDHAPLIDAADAALATTDYDLILLDIMLPDGDGRDFLRSYRRDAKAAPVIVLTARSEVSDRVSLLDLGADDYITKPFDFAELEARCRAVMRRQGGSADNIKTFEDVVFDSHAGTLTIAGASENLRNRELRLLEVFFSAPAQIFSKTHLMDRLFSFSEDVSENAIEVYVGRLRKKLEGSRASIETVRGLGYRMVAR
jgi:two-component system response regulator TctD